MQMHVLRSSVCNALSIERTLNCNDTNGAVACYSWLISVSFLFRLRQFSVLSQQQIRTTRQPHFSPSFSFWQFFPPCSPSSSSSLDSSWTSSCSDFGRRDPFRREVSSPFSRRLNRTEFAQFSRRWSSVWVSMVAVRGPTVEISDDDSLTTSGDFLAASFWALEESLKAWLHFYSNNFVIPPRQESSFKRKQKARNKNSCGGHPFRAKTRCFAVLKIARKNWKSPRSIGAVAKNTQRIAACSL